MSTSPLERYKSHFSDEEFLPHKIAIIFSLYPIQIVGFIGWFLVLLAILRDRLHQDANYILIINLGIADIILAASAFAQTITFFQNQGYPGGYFRCATELYFLMLGFISSPMAIFSIAADRYCCLFICEYLTLGAQILCITFRYLVFVHR